MKPTIKRITLVVIGMLFSALAHGEEPTATNATTVDAVKMGIVGVWHGVWDEPNFHMSKLLSFDAEGRITEDGIVAEMGVLGSEANRQGKIKYRLEQRNDGPGINLIEYGDDHKEGSCIYIIDAIAEDKLSMRAFNAKTKETFQLVHWKRIKKEPYKIEEAQKAIEPSP
jgi:hypothetical protein